MVSIVHADADVVVVDKPAGVVVHTCRGAAGRPLVQRVRDALGRAVWPLHRLDAATSGLLAFGLSQTVAGRLAPRFGRGEVDKRYVALVRGVPPESGLIDHPLPRTEGGPRIPAISGFRRLWSNGRYSLVAVRPRTGRRHQVRRHLKHESWPVIGDVRYGKGEHNRFFRSTYELNRLALHAGRLALEHPAGEWLVLKAPLPPDLLVPLQRLGVSEEALEAAVDAELPEVPAPTAQWPAVDVESAENSKATPGIGRPSGQRDCKGLSEED